MTNYTILKHIIAIFIKVLKKAGRDWGVKAKPQALET